MFIVAALLAIGISGSGTSPPDVKDFTPVLSKELEFQIDDYKTALIGRVVVYQNPNNKNEFVRVYYRQVDIISKRAQEKSNSETSSRDTNLSNLKYHNQEEKEILGRVQKAIDAFAYVQEWTVRDLRTGQDIRTGHRKIWLLDSSGIWVYFVQPANEKSALNSSPFSEPSKANPEKRINIGIKFVLVDGVHIVRIDQDNIYVSDKEEANGKK